MMQHDEWAARRRLFGAAVDAYDTARPGYPSAAVAWCVGEPDSPVTVLDLGAGTGKLTTTLLEMGHRVIAVEPDKVMLDRLVENFGRRESLKVAEGSAEKLPVDDDAVDAVISGQAFHWFEPERALPEMRRVLRQDGWASAIWNTRDETVPWVQEMSRVLGESAEATHGATGRNILGEVDFGPDFSAAESKTFRQVQLLDRDGIHALALSRSYTMSLPESKRRHMLDELDRLIETHPDLGETDQTRLPYIVECYRTTCVS